MSTATTSLRLIKQAQSDTGWGLLLNSGVMDVVDLAVAGTANIATTGGTTTLDNVDYVADNGKAAILSVTGALASNATIVIPNASKTYIVVNGTTNAFSLSVKTSSGSAITIPQGYAQTVRCDGSNGTTYVTPAIVGSSGNLAGVTFAGDITVPDEAYDATAWNGSLEAPTKNAIRDYLETLTGTTLPAAYQPLDADLTSWAGITRASGFDTFTATPSSANLRALLSDETGTGLAYFQGGDAGTPSALVLTNATGLTSAGVAAAALVTAADTVASNDNDTTWPTTAAVIDYAQPLDSDLTAIAALTTTAAGRSALTIADPGADRIMAWDDSAGSFAAIALADITTEAAPAAGDYFLMYLADGSLAKVDWNELPGAGSSATTALDNLASVAINTSLLSDTDNTDDLGDATFWWRTGYFKTSIELGATDTTLTRGAAGIPACEGVNLVTVSASQTLTNKTLTSPVIGTSPTAAGATWTDLGTVTTADINGGTIDGTVIGGASAAAGTFAAIVGTSLSIGTSGVATVGTIELGAASDTTVSRSAAGVIAVEGVPLYSNIPVNSQSAAYTTVLADAQKFILHPTADNNARTFTIDSNANVAYPIGTCITFVNQINTVTISITADTMTWAGSASTGSRTLAANGMATALKVSTTGWVINGVGLS